MDGTTAPCIYIKGGHPIKNAALKGNYWGREREGGGVSNKKLAQVSINIYTCFLFSVLLNTTTISCCPGGPVVEHKS